LARRADWARRVERAKMFAAMLKENDDGP